MKKYIFYFLLIAAAVLTACSDDGDGPTDPNGEAEVTASAYYPGNTGTTHNYRTDTLNTTTQEYDQVGTRESRYSGTQTESGTEYIVQTHTTSTLVLPEPDETDMLFRTTDAGVYVYVDTTGLSDLVAELAAEYEIEVSVNPDVEITMLSTPLETGRTWTAYKLNIEIEGLDAALSLVDITANYMGEESVTFGSETQSAAKIVYDIKVSVPNPQTVFPFESETYTATGWYVENVGLVKLEAPGILLSLFSADDLDFDLDVEASQSVILETLTSYSIQ